MTGRLQRWFVAAGALACALQAQAWSGHTLCTRQALAVMTEVAGAPPVRAEPLERFVAAEAPGLASLLRDHEAWARAHLPGYAPRPDSLAFDAASPEPIVPRFLQALRLNSDIRLKLYVQLPPGQAMGERSLMPWVDITALKSGSAARGNRYVLLADGESTPAIDVVATASAEPDYGLDIGLFADNGTAQGQAFGYGRQPFGSPSVDYSSQAPFHMGFFHESGIVNAAAPFLRRTQPQARVALFSALSRHAFASGHDYWGWRFAGWAMHYVQDLTQPYHARVLPGLSTLRMLWINTLDLMGASGAKNDAINLVTNRHIVLENYQFRRVSSALERQDSADPLLVALRDTRRDGEHRTIDSASLRTVVSAEAAGDADALDDRIERSFPVRLVADPGNPLGNDADLIDTVKVVQEAPAAEREAFERHLAELLARYGRHSRALLRSVIPAR